METTAASGIEPNWSLLRRLMERAPSLGWRASGLWALDVLEDRLGAEWPAKFGNKPSGIPAEIAWAAGHTGAFTWLMELALRLHILGEATGMAAVRKGMVTDLREESLRHACLQLEVATLALGGGWDVALECHLPDATSPVDVSLKRGDQAFGVETRIVFQDADMRDDAEYSSSIHDSILALEVKHEVTIGRETPPTFRRR